MSVSSDSIVTMAAHISQARTVIDSMSKQLQRLDEECAQRGAIRVRMGNNVDVDVMNDSWVVLAMRTQLKSRIRRAESKIARIEQSIERARNGGVL